uniref:Uncharacterized protein n=1 Tax=Schistosoma haematobium TaxID=6185 RepID=A0A094ZHE3_SCHHA
MGGYINDTGLAMIVFEDMNIGARGEHLTSEFYSEKRKLKMVLNCLISEIAVIHEYIAKQHTRYDIDERDTVSNINYQWDNVL